MTDVRYLNDRTEMHYAAGLIDEVISRRISVREPYSSWPGAFTDLAQRFIETADSMGRRPYVACFSEAGDQLSQWRGYGDGTGGVAIGFLTDEIEMVLSRAALPGRASPLTLLPVVYDPDEQRRQTEEAADRFLDTVAQMQSDGHSIGDALPVEASSALENEIIPLLLSFKHPAFSEEREWRLVRLISARDEAQSAGHRKDAAYWRSSSQVRAKSMDELVRLTTPPSGGLDLKFREANGMLTPFISEPLRTWAGPRAGKLPIAQVKVGPTSEPNLSAQSVQLCLTSAGYSRVDVEISSVPLR